MTITQEAAHPSGPDMNLAATPLVRVEGVSRRFGAVVALEDVTLEIRSGEFFCLLGPSGCGKTTLLRMIAGFETPEAGRILLEGTDLVGTPPHRRPVNMMFQSYALFPHLSVAGNVAFGLRQEALPKAEIKARVAEMLALVRLAGFEHRFPAQLSGGQRQRVALARALAKCPRLLLLDEPLAALDRKLREETRVELKDIQHRLGTTFVVVTHDQDEAMAMADRIAVLDCGRVAQVGTPREIYERPANRFVAGFVGDVTLIAGQVVSLDDDDVVSIATTVSTVPLQARGASGAWRAGQPVSLAIRPETLRLVRDGTAGACDNQLTGAIGDIAYLGEVTLYRVVLISGETARVSELNSSRQGAGLQRGSTVTLAFSPDAAVILPA